MSMQQIPLLLKPFYKRTLWGGAGIPALKGESSDFSDIGESWEVSALTGCESTVEGGTYHGKSVSQLVQEFGKDFLGEAVAEKYGDDFPLLVKLIDARDDLSVQVHPDDALAARRHGSPGKTEMWYILKTAPSAKIYAGLKKGVDRALYLRHVADGTTLDIVEAYDSAPGDTFFLAAGQVHAIGSGNLLAEIQQPSDVTYRIFDFNRRDAQGNARELHTELALDAIDFESEKSCFVSGADDSAKERVLADCRYFKTTLLRVDGETHLPLPEGRFSIIVCTDGEVNIKTAEGSLKLTAGHTALLPAVVREAQLDGDASVLHVIPGVG